MVQDKQRIRTAFDETKADLELVWEEQERRARALAGLL